MTDTPKLNDDDIRALMDKATDGPWEAIRLHSDWGMPRLNVIVPVGADPYDHDKWLAEIPSITPYCVGASRAQLEHSAKANANASLFAAASTLARLALERGAERDAFRAVLEGAEYRGIDNISKQSADTNRALGREIARSTKQVIDELNAALARAEAAEAERDRLREALQRIADASKVFAEPEMPELSVRYAHETTRRLATAALNTQEGGE